MPTSAIPWVLMRPLRVTIAATYKRLSLPVNIVGNCEGPMGGQVESGSSKRTEDHRIQQSWGAMPGLSRQEGYSKQGHKMAWRKNTAVPGTDTTAFVLDALWFMGLPPATTIQEPCLAEPLAKGGGWAQHMTQAILQHQRRAQGREHGIHFNSKT